MTRAPATLTYVSESIRRPATVVAAAVLSWTLAGVLVLAAAVLAAVFERSVHLTPTDDRAPFALAVVTVLCTTGVIVALGGLALWMRKTDMLLVFGLWLLMVAAAVLPTLPIAPRGLAPAIIGSAVIAAAAVPIVLVLRPSARSWLPPIPLHDAVLVIVFGPIIGLVLVTARQRHFARLGIA